MTQMYFPSDRIRSVQECDPLLLQPFRALDEHDFGGPDPAAYEFEIDHVTFYDDDAQPPFKVHVPRDVLGWLAQVGCTYEFRAHAEHTTFDLGGGAQYVDAIYVRATLAIWDRTAATAYRLAFA